MDFNHFCFFYDAYQFNSALNRKVPPAEGALELTYVLVQPHDMQRHARVYADSKPVQQPMSRERARERGPPSGDGPLPAKAAVNGLRRSRSSASHLLFGDAML